VKIVDSAKTTAGAALIVTDRWTSIVSGFAAALARMVAITTTMTPTATRSDFHMLLRRWLVRSYHHTNTAKDVQSGSPAGTHSVLGSVARSNHMPFLVVGRSVVEEVADNEEILARASVRSDARHMMALPVEHDGINARSSTR